jgi:halimadienyl-diphosphate synthase
MAADKVDSRFAFAMPEDILNAPLSGVNAATYDTAQVLLHTQIRPDRFGVSLAANATALLLRTQNADGSWGAPQWPVRYRMVPTLAAVSALAGSFTEAVAAAVYGGVGYLRQHATAMAPLAQPDLVASELIIPALCEHLVHLIFIAPENTVIGRWSLEDRHVLSRFAEQILRVCDTDRVRLHRLRDAYNNGGQTPPYLVHSIELLSGAAADSAGAVTVPVGCSAAATAAVAAYSGRPRPDAVDLLQRQSRVLDGGFPVIMRMETFELLWVCGALVRSAIPMPESVRSKWISCIRGVLTSEGVCAGPGVPPDGDDTAAALYLLGRLQRRAVSPDTLLRFVRDDGCASTPGERTRSTTATAHALEALGLWLNQDSDGCTQQHMQAHASLIRYLIDTQNNDGTWRDKWHASPLYATTCAVLALSRYGGQPGGDAVQRAVDWTLESQNTDGSWGIWAATLEETAMALDILTASSEAGDARRRAAVFLNAHHNAPTGSPLRPPLWHGKELYYPHRIVETTIDTARAMHR